MTADTIARLEAKLAGMASEDLSESELAALSGSSGDDCCMAAVRCVVREIRRRRALDLTPFERVVIESLRRTIAADPLTDQAALAVLDKLLGPR